LADSEGRKVNIHTPSNSFLQYLVFVSLAHVQSSLLSLWQAIFSSWLLVPITLDLWEGRTSWQEACEEQSCSLLGSWEAERARKKV
jgi:hypothetical protein